MQIPGLAARIAGVDSTEKQHRGNWRRRGIVKAVQSGLAILIGVASSTWGQESDRLETVIVTGSYVPAAINELTASVTVIDEQRLRQLNKRQLGGVLRTVPGLLIEEQGGNGGLTAVSVRGGEANFTQILLDGVPLNDPTNSRGGSYDIGSLSSVTIARIEVVRGPQSAVYGSDALSGVVNLISQDPREALPPTLRLELGESGYQDYSLSLGGKVSELGVALDVSHRDSGNGEVGSEREVDDANIRLHWQPGEAHQILAQLRYLDGERSSYPEQSGGPLYAMSNAVDTSDFSDQTAAVTWNAQWSARWRSSLSASYFQHREAFSSPGVAPFTEVPPNASDTRYERDQLRWINTLELADNYQLNFGADYRDEEGDSTGYLDYGVLIPTDYQLGRSTAGLFLDARTQPLQGLIVQASVRRDEPDGFDQENTLRVGASYALLPSVTLRTNWGEGFKLPSFFALGHALVGNPELQPETARGWDVGLQWQIAPALEMSGTVFSNRYRNLVDFDPEAFTNVNRRQVETSGAEWQLDWEPSEALSGQIHATYTDIDVVGERAALLGRPAWKAGGWLSYQIAPHWRASFDYEWTGVTPASSLHSGETTVFQLDDYHRLDWQLRWRPSNALELDLALDNLLDEEYQTAVGFPAPGRTLRVAATLRLGSST